MPSRTAIDFFCGAGGMSLGFVREGFEVLAAYDRDPRHLSVYRKNFPSGHAITADIASLTGTSVRALPSVGDRKIDVVFGGPPCQGFSSAGLRRTEDPRNQLLLHFGRLVGELRPRAFVLENVAGLLAAQYRPLLEEFLAGVRANGYHVPPDPRPLDASQFGVPQRRKRVFLVGYLDDCAVSWPPTSVAPAECAAPNVRDAIGDLPEVLEHPHLVESDVHMGPLGTPSAYAAALRVGRSPDQGLSGCLRTAHTADVVQRFALTLPGATESVSRFARLDWNGIAPTLRAGTPLERGKFMAPRPIHPTAARCITVREAARLHSYPDSFEFHPTKWYGFMEIGNSVPPLLAQAVARSVALSLTGAAAQSTTFEK